MSEPPVVELMFSPGESVIATSLSPVGEGVPESSVIESMLESGGDVIVTSLSAVGVGVNMNVETLMATEALECAVSVSYSRRVGSYYWRRVDSCTTR